MEYPRETLSSAEEEILRRTDAALGVLATRYLDFAQHQIRQLNTHILCKQWPDAAQVAHSIAGEAATFNFGHAARSATLLRDFLLSPAPDVIRDIIHVASETLALLVQTKVAKQDAERLIDGLEAVAHKPSTRARS